MNNKGIDRQTLEELEQTAVKELGEASYIGALEDLRVKYLGRKGSLTLSLRSIGALPADERPEMGNLINEIKGKLSGIYPPDFIVYR